MTRFFFVEPLDVVAFRGNKMFGQSGSFGETSVMPYPSVFAGAFRSILFMHLSRSGKMDFLNNVAIESELGSEIGTSSTFGSLKISWSSLAVGELEDETVVSAQPLYPLPSDSISFDGGDSALARLFNLEDFSIVGCYSTRTPIVVTKNRGKRQNVYCHTNEYLKYLNGESDFKVVSTSEFVKMESRVGIKVDGKYRTAVPGGIYSSNYHRLKINNHESYGYLVGLNGSTLIPKSGILRLGADGKAAAYTEVKTNLPTTNYAVLAKRSLFKVVVQTPIISDKGWLPELVNSDNALGGEIGQRIGAVLIGSSIPKREILSGWDISTNRPKPARGVVPSGSVYFFEYDNSKVSKDDLQSLDRQLVDGLLCANENDRKTGYGIAQLGITETVHYRTSKKENINNV